jgi:phosphoribosylformylglycinamidine synthase subunit PurL
VYFEEAYEGNCLINAMAIGLMREEDLMLAVAAGPGNLIVLIGSTTGRDGIGGASVLASQEFDEKAEDKRPSVQVGDPFTEKLLIEACLELLQRDLLVALGDLGAAGLTSSASEMASRGGVGLEIDVTLVPQREDAMKPFEIMVSESQERMLAVVTPEHLGEVQDICERWGLPATVIGQVTDTGRFVIREGDEVVGDMPAATLAHDAPIYDPPAERPPTSTSCSGSTRLPNSTTPRAPRCSRPRSSTCSQAPTSARAGGSGSSTTTRSCSTRSCCRARTPPCCASACPGAARSPSAPSPHRATATAATATSTRTPARRSPWPRPRATSRARAGDPAAITDCLNFGSPEKPEVFWTFVESIRGMADACRAWEVPVISGNVSFYNESFGQPIYPTPTVGLVGILENVAHHTTLGFKEAGDVVVLLGETEAELGGSEYLKVVHETVPACRRESISTPRPRCARCCSPPLARGSCARLMTAPRAGWPSTLAESCIAGGIGADIHIGDELPVVAELFSETQGRVVVTVAEDAVERLFELAFDAGVPFAVIGTVGGEALRIEGLVEAGVAEMRDVFESALAGLVHPEVTISTQELREG